MKREFYLCDVAEGHNAQATSNVVVRFGFVGFSWGVKDKIIVIIKSDSIATPDEITTSLLELKGICSVRECHVNAQFNEKFLEESSELLQALKTFYLSRFKSQLDDDELVDPDKLSDVVAHLSAWMANRPY